MLLDLTAGTSPRRPPMGAARQLHAWWRRMRRRVAGMHESPYLVFAPGHFYSPLPDPGFVAAHRQQLFGTVRASLPAIDVNESQQLRLLEKLGAHADDLPWQDRPVRGLRYHYGNTQFTYGDAVVLQAMLRLLRPRRVIEVGAGHSSALMLDTADRWLDAGTSFTFIEPYPDRLRALLTAADTAGPRPRCEVIEQPVQAVPLERFDELAAGDILFIDSSHVVKIGSDVVHLLTWVLPRLQRGVFVHFHDVFWPFEYPEPWLREGRAWNECYVLAAFLQYNAAFAIALFNSWLVAFRRAEFARHLPLAMRNTGGSLWLEKRGDALRP
jgi:predicted O-methyltransferase YrrM